MTSKLLFIVLTLLNAIPLSAQENADSLHWQIPGKYLARVTAKAGKLSAGLEKNTKKAFTRFDKLEERIFRKLSRSDPSRAKELDTRLQAKHAQLETKMEKPGSAAQYVPGLDSLYISLLFLESRTAAGSRLMQAKENLEMALGRVVELRSGLQRADDIKTFLRERKELLRENLEKLGFVRELKMINKQVYYYSTQLREYRAALNDPEKIERKALDLLSRTRQWKDFFRKNSMLASLFRLPNPDEPLNMANLAGLQTRSQVNNLIQAQITAGGPNAQQLFQQNIQAAQSQLNELKGKTIKAGVSSSDAEIPEGFMPNNQKTKSFLQRLEYGANVQSQKANSYFPATSDLGLSLGYKLNDKSVIGIGASYKLGWGRGWNNISITHQGVALRGYVDWKIKGSFWLSGGYEQNFRSAFNDFGQLRIKSGWQQSGLIGLSKTVSVKSKLFKKTKLMMLWDFLSYEQVPKSQPLIFRIGYNFK